MGCGGKISDLCGGKKQAATCVKYEGDIPEFSDLIECDCHTVEEVIEDLYKEVGEILESIDLSEIESGCLNFPKQDDGKVLVKDAIEILAQKYCELEDSLPSDEPECEGCVDTCDDNGCSTGLVYYNYADGEMQVYTGPFTNWQMGGNAYATLHHTVQKSGNYKVTVDVSCEPDDPNSDMLVGVGINTIDPLSGPFNQYKLDPEFDSRTIHFILTGVKKLDVLRLKFKFNTGIVVVDGVKMIIEKV